MCAPSLNCQTEGNFTFSSDVSHKTDPLQIDEQTHTSKKANTKVEDN